MTIPIKIDRQELAKQLKKSKIPLHDWYEKCYELNNVLDDFNSPLCFEWGQDSIQVSTFNHKSSYRIILEGDAYTRYENYNQFANDIMRYHNEAMFLEKHIPKLGWSKLQKYLDATQVK